MRPSGSLNNEWARLVFGWEQATERERELELILSVAPANATLIWRNAVMCWLLARLNHADGAVATWKRSTIISFKAANTLFSFSLSSSEKPPSLPLPFSRLIYSAKSSFAPVFSAGRMEVRQGVVGGKQWRQEWSRGLTISGTEVGEHGLREKQGLVSSQPLCTKPEFHQDQKPPSGVEWSAAPFPHRVSTDWHVQMKTAYKQNPNPALHAAPSAHTHAAATPHPQTLTRTAQCWASIHSLHHCCCHGYGIFQIPGMGEMTVIREGGIQNINAYKCESAGSTKSGFLVHVRCSAEELSGCLCFGRTLTQRHVDSSSPQRQVLVRKRCSCCMDISS